MIVHTTAGWPARTHWHPVNHHWILVATDPMGKRYADIALTGPPSGLSRRTLRYGIDQLDKTIRMAP